MRRQKLASRLLGGGRGLLVAGLLGAASCGAYPDGLVVVRVSGLLSTITALQVQVKLDDTTARNPSPQPNLESTAFVVYDDMQRFGVQVPTGTATLCLCIKGNNTSLEVVRSGTAVVHLAEGREVSVALSQGTACDIATLACAAH